MNGYGDRAQANFEAGYNCAQSVLLAFAPEVGLSDEVALRLASSFGGGMGRLREVCGALSALFMVAGLLEGYADPAAAEEKAAHYARIQSYAAAFREENGSLICRELLGLPEGPDSPVPAPRTVRYYRRRPCAALVRSAAEILERSLP